MKNAELTQSKVKFIAETHQYFNADGVGLSGVTSIINKYIFPDKYKGVSEEVLQQAAERGTLIHTLCEEYATEGKVTMFMPDEVAGFIAATQGVKFIAAEYLVSDDEHVATMIDLVDTDLNLYDIKTTSTLDREYLGWQLSIEAALFEIQNPGKQVGKLVGVWLRPDRCEMVEVKRLPDKAVEALIIAHIEGAETFDNPLKQLDTTETEYVEKLVDIERAIINLETEAKKMKEARQQYTDFLLAEMQKRGVKTLETDNIKLTVKAAYTQKKLDSTRLKADHKELCEKYEKQIQVKESLIVKIK